MKVYDADIRARLYANFTQNLEFTAETDTVVINEFDVCAGVSRVDITVINGKMHGYEIKSKQDNLERIAKQSAMYCKVFDTLTVVAYQSHLEKLENFLPEWWGIQVVYEQNGDILISEHRIAELNPLIDSQSVAMLLWRDEMIDILSRLDYPRSTKGKTRRELSKIMAQNLDGLQLSRYVRDTLKARQSWKAQKLSQLYDG